MLPFYRTWDGEVMIHTNERTKPILPLLSGLCENRDHADGLEIQAKDSLHVIWPECAESMAFLDLHPPLLALDSLCDSDQSFRFCWLKHKNIKDFINIVDTYLQRTEMCLLLNFNTLQEVLELA